MTSDEMHGFIKFLLRLETSRLTVVSREAKKHKARAHNNKHATTTVSHLHEGSITQSFKIRMVKSQVY